MAFCWHCWKAGRCVGVVGGGAGAGEPATLTVGAPKIPEKRRDPRLNPTPDPTPETTLSFRSCPVVGAGGGLGARKGAIV